MIRFLVLPTEYGREKIKLFLENKTIKNPALDFSNSQLPSKSCCRNIYYVIWNVNNVYSLPLHLMYSNSVSASWARRNQSWLLLSYCLE